MKRAPLSRAQTPLALALTLLAFATAEVQARGLPYHGAARDAGKLAATVTKTVTPPKIPCDPTGKKAVADGVGTWVEPPLDGMGDIHADRHTDDFCGDPYNAVCGEYDLTIQDHFRRVQETQDAARKQGLLIAGTFARDSGLWKGDPRIFNQADLTRVYADPNLKPMQRIMLMATYAGAVKGYLTQRSKFGLKATETIRAKLKQAIIHVAPTATLGKMTDVIDQVNIVGAEEAFKDNQSSDVRDAFLQICGTDGMVNNAEARWVGSKRYVFFCTGSLVAAQFDPKGNPVDNEEAATDNLLWAMGHELSHHLGWPVYQDAEFNQWHQPFLRCLKSDFSNSYQEGQRGEALADFWAAEVTYQQMNDLKPSIEDDPAKKLKILRQSWGKLCETSSDAAHPTGRMRIEVILRLNPELSSFMGCPVPAQPDPPGCGYSGQVSR